MKFVLTTVVSIVAVLALIAGCRTTSPVSEESASGLSEISVPLPEAVAENLGSGGSAELTAKSSSGTERSFVSRISKYAGAESATTSLTFDVDQARQGLRVGDQLNGITLYLRDDANNPIYIGKGDPFNHTMRAAENEINFELTCANSPAANLKCNGQENVTVVAIQGEAGTTSASIQAKITIKSDGLTFNQLREKVAQCMETFNKHRTCSFWDAYSTQGEDACTRLAAKEDELRRRERIANLQSYVRDLKSLEALNYYVDACKNLGIFAQ